MGWLARYRHGRGFGVHSPFAYRFITDVLNERLPYYDYCALPDGRMQLLYRIACRFRPATVAALGTADVRPVLMACPGCRQAVTGAAMVCAAGDYDPAALADAAGSGCTVIIDPRRRGLAEVKERLDALGYGMTFDNCRDIAVIVADPKLPRQDFTVKF